MRVALVNNASRFVCIVNNVRHHRCFFKHDPQARGAGEASLQGSFPGGATTAGSGAGDTRPASATILTTPDDKGGIDGAEVGSGMSLTAPQSRRACATGGGGIV